MKGIYLIISLLLAAQTSFAADVLAGASDVAPYALSGTEEIVVEGIAVNHNGRVWLSTSRQIKGGDEGVVLSCSDGPESGWKDVAVVPSAHAGVLWSAPNGGLFFFYSIGSDIYVTSSPNPTDPSPVWLPSALVGKGRVTGAPVVCSDRRWALPVMEDGTGPMLYRSADMGRSWTVFEGPRDVPELNKADRNDPHIYMDGQGRLAMVCCSAGTAHSYVTLSPDNGMTWGQTSKFSYNPDRKVAVTNLAKGNVLMVKNNRIDHRAYAYAKGLYAYLTPVDGALWHGGLQIDARENAVGPVATVSKGTIYIAYTFNNRGVNEICMVVTSELEVAQAWGLPDCGPKTRMTAMTAGRSEEYFKERLNVAASSGGKQTWAKESIRAVTYNIQWHGYVKKPSWEERLKAIKKVFDDYQFDIVGVQEADTMMANTMVRTLGGKYDWVGTVETSDKTTSKFIPLNPIFYDKEKFECLEQDILWFAHAPNTIGYDSWGMRLCNYAKFRDLRTGMKFYVFNSHYDHKGHEAKDYSSVVLLNKVMEVAEGLPVILTGDFNTDENTPGYKRLIESGVVEDAMLALPAAKRENWEYFSMSNYRPKETISRNKLHIDHVFYTPATSKVLSWKLILDDCDGVFGSDHLPIMIDWKISN